MWKFNECIDDMICSKCGNSMEKEFLNANSKDKVSLVTINRCENCGFRESIQRNISK